MLREGALPPLGGFASLGSRVRVHLEIKARKFLSAVGIIGLRKHNETAESETLRLIFRTVTNLNDTSGFLLVATREGLAQAVDRCVNLPKRPMYCAMAEPYPARALA